LAVEAFDPSFLRAAGGGGGVFRAISSRSWFLIWWQVSRLWNPACDRADAAARGGGAMLDAESMADDRPLRP